MVPFVGSGVSRPRCSATGSGSGLQRSSAPRERRRRESATPESQFPAGAPPQSPRIPTGSQSRLEDSPFEWRARARRGHAPPPHPRARRPLESSAAAPDFPRPSTRRAGRGGIGSNQAPRSSPRHSLGSPRQPHERCHSCPVEIVLPRRARPVPSRGERLRDSESTPSPPGSGRHRRRRMTKAETPTPVPCCRRRAPTTDPPVSPTRRTLPLVQQSRARPPVPSANDPDCGGRRPYVSFGSDQRDLSQGLSPRATRCT